MVRRNACNWIGASHSLRSFGSGSPALEAHSHLPGMSLNQAIASATMGSSGFPGAQSAGLDGHAAVKPFLGLGHDRFPSFHLFTVVRDRQTRVKREADEGGGKGLGVSRAGLIPRRLIFFWGVAQLNPFSHGLRLIRQAHFRRGRGGTCGWHHYDGGIGIVACAQSLHKSEPAAEIGLIPRQRQ
jgi:hypothetical protein